MIKTTMELRKLKEKCSKGEYVHEFINNYFTKASQVAGDSLY